MDLKLKQLLFERDKQWHMAISAGVANILVISMLVLDGSFSSVAAFFITVVLGIMKEVGDDNTQLEHWRDMAANTIGASTCFFWLLL